jgi:hypothetical protein
MAAVIRFLAIDGEHQQVLDWFRQQPLRGRENTTIADEVVLWYESEGPRVPVAPITVSDDASPHEQKRAFFVRLQLEHAAGQPILDRESTPLVWIKLPRKLRGVLWTNGEVTFTATPLRTRFPRLAGLHRSFVRWLREFELVFGARARHSDFDYYLEGSIRNYDSEVRALPRAAAALRDGHYFVDTGIADTRVDVLCRQLRLRGVNCDPA